MSRTDRIVFFVVHGEPASKANSRQLVYNPKTRKPMFIKSKKARNYEQDFRVQCPRLDDPFAGDVQVEMDIFYASRRPDLDESVILDCMQGPIYINDRQVKQKLIRWGLDKSDPRAEITVRPWDE